jgi:hypothetical protein
MLYLNYLNNFIIIIGNKNVSFILQALHFYLLGRMKNKIIFDAINIFNKLVFSLYL